MPHAFELSALPRLIDGLKTLSERARRYEHRLTVLTDATGAATAVVSGSPSTPDAFPIMAADADLFPSVMSPPSPPALALLKDLSAAAREQRALVEQLLTDISGGVDGNSRTRSAHSVLVVDDSDDNRDLTGAILEACGFRVATARNGLEAIVAAHCTMPSAILMDVTMPVLNGIDAATLLKPSPVTRQIPVLAYTANAAVDENPHRDLFTGVLIKPAGPEAVAQLVRDAIGSPNRRE